MTDVERLEQEEAAILEQWKPLTERLDAVRKQIRVARSRAWIAENNVTLDKIENPDELGRPYFGVSWDFGKWLQSQPTRKPFALWGTVIYRTADLIARTMPDMPGRYEHVPALPAPETR